MNKNKSKKKKNYNQNYSKSKKKGGYKKKLQTLKKMNCNPGVKGYTVSSNTCYTKDTLLKIKNAYNKKNPSNRITSNIPNIIINQLRSKLQCGKEDCLLNQLSNHDKKKIDDEIFAPDHPNTWKKNPTEWLSNYDILNVLKQYEKTFKDFKFLGPTPIDFASRENGTCIWPELCNIDLKKMLSKKINKIGIIFNLDKHDESGSHWVSMFINIKDGIIFYFDSAANQIPQEITNLSNLIIDQSSTLNIPMKYLTNCPKQHQQSNTECGMYSLYFIITMIDDSKTMKSKRKMFQKETITDHHVQSFRNKYFNSK